MYNNIYINKWPEALLALLTAAHWLTLVATQDGNQTTTSRPLQLNEERPGEFNLEPNTTNKAEQRLDEEASSSVHDTNRVTANEPDGQSRSSGGLKTKVPKWLATLHSGKPAGRDHKFIGAAIVVAPGAMVVHSTTLLRVGENEAEQGHRPDSGHIMYINWPAKEEFRADSLDDVRVGTYKRLNTVSSLIIMATRPMNKSVRYPSPDEYPVLPSKDENPKEDCFVYSWDDRGLVDANARRLRVFVKMPVIVDKCCDYSCELNLPGGEDDLCGASTDYGSPVVCQGKLSYIVHHITNQRCDNKYFLGHKVSTMLHDLQTADTGDARKHRTPHRNRPRSGNKLIASKKTAKSGTKRTKQSAH